MKKKTAVPNAQKAGSDTASVVAKTNSRVIHETDVLLIGGGIMSATLGTWLQELEPNWSITMVEQMESVAEESSNGWNNAGTGHSALMELNYTPQKRMVPSALKKLSTSTKRSRSLASSGRIR